MLPAKPLELIPLLIHPKRNPRMLLVDLRSNASEIASFNFEKPD